MSDILLADGFGYLKNGVHVLGTDHGIIGRQWASYNGNFTITDLGDGRKTISGSSVMGLSSGLLPGYPQSVSICFWFERGANSDQNIATLRDSWGGKLGAIIYRHSNTDLIYQIGSTDLSYDAVMSAGPSVSLSSGAFYEVRVYLHNTAGSVTWYVNGSLSSSTTGIDTTRSNHIGIQYVDYFPSYLSQAANKFTDLLIHSGSAPIGEAKVYYDPIIEAGSDADFTPSAGANEDNVEDASGTDGDTTYNESDGTSGDRDSLKGAGRDAIIPISVGTLVRARKTGIGPGMLKIGPKHGASENLSGALGLSVDYMNLLQFDDENPSTSSAWLADEIVASELVYEVD